MIFHHHQPITELWITESGCADVVSVRGHIMFSHRGDVLDRMCDSIFVPDGCCGNSCFNPREGFEQLLMSAVVQVDFLGC